MPIQPFRHREAAIQTRSKLSRKEIWEWVRYIITTLIALIALFRTFI